MTFSTIIRKISGIAAMAFIYIVVASIYMSAKGFGIDENGKVSLINQASAQPQNFSQPLKKRAVINLSNPHYLGDEKAPITIYEYSSFGCSHCADFHLSTLKKLDEEFIKTGKIKVALIPFPIDKKSMQGALIAACVPNEKYHDFANMMFNKQREWLLSSKSEELILGYATQNGITREEAQECMKNDRIISEVLANRQQGFEELKIQGTPSFLFDDGETQELIVGAPSYGEFKKYLQEKSAKKSAK